MSTVAVVRCFSYNDAERNINRLMELIGVNKVEADRVVIKINLCGLRTPETGAITHPLFLNALLKCLRTRFGEKMEIVVVESDATTSLPSLFIKWLGFQEVLNKWNAKFVNLSRARGSVKIKEGILKGQRIPDVFNGSYFISLAKLKTHIATKITCVLKNQFGCIPYPRKIRYHRSLDEAIVEANKYFKPNLSIVDGIIALTGTQGPSYGIPVHAGVILASKDPVACDSLCAKLLGFSPRSVRHIKLSEKVGIGTSKYKLVGDQIDFKINSHWGFLESHAMNIGMKLLNRARRKVSQW
jgi:uncharacterized protein (DUF362 family)